MLFEHPDQPRYEAGDAKYKHQRKPDYQHEDVVADDFQHHLPSMVSVSVSGKRSETGWAQHPFQVTSINISLTRKVNASRIERYLPVFE